MADFVKTERTKKIDGRSYEIYKKPPSNRLYIKQKGRYILFSSFKKRSLLGGGDDCFLNKVIYSIYDNAIFFPKDQFRSGVCFTRGTFIIEDQHATLFSRIINKPCKVKNANWKITHIDVSKKPAFHCFLDAKNVCGNAKYEIDIEPAIIYLCDQECRVNSNNCMDSKKDPKRVAFVYHFITKDKKEYTLIKLESHKTISIQHTMNAIKRYILKINHTSFYKSTRREDCHKDKEGCLNRNLHSEYHIRQFLAAYPAYGKSMFDSIEYYNKNVRTGDEFFIPQAMTTTMLLAN